jgi:hypothetical protein
MPAFGSYLGIVPDDFYQPLLHGPYQFFSQIGCKTLGSEGGWQIGDESMNGTQRTGQTIVWDGDAGRGPIVVTSKDRSAEGRGNLYLASSAALAALSIGFMPVAADEGRKWWGRRRPRRS